MSLVITPNDIGLAINDPAAFHDEVGLDDYDRALDPEGRAQFSDLIMDYDDYDLNKQDPWGLGEMDDYEQGKIYRSEPESHRAGLTV